MADCEQCAALSASQPAPSPRDGFDAIPISNLRACVSDKCKNVAAYKMEFFNVGANYCQQCAGKIAELLSISLPPVTQVVRDFEQTCQNPTCPRGPSAND